MDTIRLMLSRLWQRLANEPAAVIAVVLVVIGADVDAVANAAETIEANADTLLGLVAVRQSVDGPVTRRRKDREREQDRAALDQYVHPKLDAAEDSHAD